MTTTTSDLIELLTKIVDSDDIPPEIRCDAQEILRKFQRDEVTVAETKKKGRVERAYAVVQEDGRLRRAYDVQMLFRVKKDAEGEVDNARCRIVMVELCVVDENSSPSQEVP